MERVRATRRNHVDLLTRPPSGAGSLDGGWARLVVDPVAQLHGLADLRDRGLLSDEQYEQQRRKVLDG